MTEPSDVTINKKVSPSNTPQAKKIYNLMYRYGITLDEYKAMLEKQGFLCALCQAAPATHVDHDHYDGRIRGILCGPCNLDLEGFETLSRKSSMDSIRTYLQLPHNRH